jgi:hypothetical protein
MAAFCPPPPYGPRIICRSCPSDPRQASRLHVLAGLRLTRFSTDIRMHGCIPFPVNETRKETFERRGVHIWKDNPFLRFPLRSTGLCLRSDWAARPSTSLGRIVTMKLVLQLDCDGYMTPALNSLVVPHMLVGVASSNRISAHQKDSLNIFPAPSLTTPIVDEGFPRSTTRNSRFSFSALVHVKTERENVRFPRTLATKYPLP